MSYKEETYLKNKHTGEVTPRSNFEVLPETHSYWKKDKGEIDNQFLKGSYFHFITATGSNLLRRFDIGYEDLGRVFLLLTYTSYRNTSKEKMYIKFDNKKNNMSSTAMRTKLKLSDKVFSQFKIRMVDKGILSVDDEGFYFTDDLVIRGRIYRTERYNKDYYKIMDAPVRKLYDIVVEKDKVRTAKSMGVLIMLIPFIRRNNNSLMICDGEDEKLATITSLANHLKVDRKSFSASITTLNKCFDKIYGEPIVYEVSMRPAGIKDPKYHKKGLIVNPKLTYTSDTSAFLYLIEEIGKMIVTY